MIGEVPAGVGEDWGLLFPARLLPLAVSSLIFLHTNQILIPPGGSSSGLSAVGLLSALCLQVLHHPV